MNLMFKIMKWNFNILGCDDKFPKDGIIFSM